VLKVTFLHVGWHSRLAELMVESLSVMDAEIIHLTDRVTPQVTGSHKVIRKHFDGNLMTFRMEHLADLEGEWLTLDTDIIVRKDLSHVMEQDFDVALTKRTKPIYDESGINIVDYMPYNTGVMFSKNQQFWQDAYQLLLDMPEEAHRWWGDQLSVYAAANTGKYQVTELDCDTYNYSPNSADDDKDCHVLHFKGKRKEWMLNGNY